MGAMIFVSKPIVKVIFENSLKLVHPGSKNRIFKIGD